MARRLKPKPKSRTKVNSAAGTNAPAPAAAIVVATSMSDVRAEERRQEEARQRQTAQRVAEFYNPELRTQRLAWERRIANALSEVFVQGIPYV